jgi:predicted transcriptional regulator
MAKVSRSSKKQPAFDPSELSDLIFSPAVGTGVGSHLLDTPLHPDQTIVDMSGPATVDMPPAAPVGTLEPTTVDRSPADLTTVAAPDLTSVDTSTRHHPAPEAPVDLTTVEQPVTNRVDESNLSTVARKVVFWITEGGDLVPQGRVKRIQAPQDVINSAEEAVYNTLWAANPGPAAGPESFRLIQAGYDYICKKTRLSKKTVQRIVAKLIDKEFVAIERPADIYQRTSTVYRVFGYASVLEHHINKGRSHVAKLGPGFSYVRPLNDSGRDLSTVPQSNGTTVAPSDLSTEVSLTEGAAIRQALSRYGTVDDAVVHRLIRSCRQQAADCTEAEIIHFIDNKGSLVRDRDNRGYSPLGFLLAAVPKCLSGEPFRRYRQDRARAEAERQAELDEWRREQELQLADPLVSEEEKRFIRETLRIS